MSTILGGAEWTTAQWIGVIVIICLILIILYHHVYLAEPAPRQQAPRKRGVDFGKLIKSAAPKAPISMEEVQQDWAEIIKDMDVDKADRDSHREFVDDYTSKVHRGGYSPFNNQVASHLTTPNPTIGLGRWRAAWVSSRPNEDDRQLPGLDLPDLNIGDNTTYQTAYGDMQN